MKRFLWVFLVLVFVTITGRVSGQTLPQDFATQKLPDDEATATALEDIEILGRLLERSIGKAYGLPVPRILDRGMSTASFNLLLGQSHAGVHHGTAEIHPLPHPEGMYFSGKGVIYTVTLPPPLRDPLGTGDKPGSKPLSDWERTRRELHGEKSEAETPASKEREPALADALLRVLAENGKNLRALKENDSVTVVATFRQAGNCALCHDMRRDALRGWFQDGSKTSGPMYPQTGTPSVSGPASGMTPPGSPTSPGSTPGRDESPERTNLVLGDLHLKQGKLQEALAAYRKGLESAERKLDPGSWREKTATTRDIQSLLVVVNLYTKMAEVYVGLGDKTQAETALRGAARVSKLAEELQSKEAQSPKKPSLPAKLIITVSHKALQQAGDGKMSFDDFRKAATIQHLTFAEEKKKEE
jgi:hypothetical protein